MQKSSIDFRSSTVLLKTVFLFFLLLAMGCSTGDSPREVAEQFLTYFGNNEFDKAKDLGTAETDRLLEMMEALETMSVPGSVKVKKYEVVEVKPEGNSCTVSYREAGDDKSLKEMKLIKEEGKWQVSLDKSMLSGDEQGTLEIGGTATQPQ